MIGKLGEEANQRTTHQIDGQGAEGKLNTLTELLRIATHKVPQDGPDEPAGADEKKYAQRVTLSKM